MSAELLLNLEKNTNKSIALNNNSTKPLDSTKKNEGASLFDSLLNEAKKGHDTEITDTDKKKNLSSSNLELDDKTNTVKEKVVNSKTLDENTDVKKLDKNLKDGTVDNVKSNINSQDIKSTEILKDTKIANGKTSSVVFQSVEKDNDQLQKLVDKLVDIVVSAAKDVIKDGSIDSNKLTNTVENILENKINNIVQGDELQNLVDKKLDIVSTSITKIKNETNLVNIGQNIDQEQDNTIKNEVSLIQNSIKVLEKKLLTDGITKISQQDDVEIDETIKNISTKTLKNDILIKDLTDEQIDKSIVNNDNLAQIKKDLSLISENTDEIKTLLDKDNVDKQFNNTEIVTNTVNKVEYKIDEIEESVINIKEKVSDTIIVSTLKKDNIQSLTTIVENTDEISDSLKKPLLAAMFLTTQKITKDQTSLENIRDARNNIVDKQSLESVKSSAEKLNLNIENTDVSHEEEIGNKPISKEKVNSLEINNLLDNRSLNKAVITSKIQIETMIQEENIINSKNIELSKNLVNSKDIDSIDIIVSKEAIPALQSKIIGAQQKLGSFMNDVARNMYLNYKPPVTAFRVNLNPANLGSISIIMKANKVDNSLSVSMNLSNSNTLEAMSENKVALQTAIQRQFNDNSNVSIDFGMQDNAEQKEFGQNNNNDNNKNQNKDDNKSDVDTDIEEEREISINNDYM